MNETAEKRENLWTLAASPMIWAAHFLLSYGIAAVYCAKFVTRDASLVPVRIAIAALTVVAVAAIALIGLRARGRHRMAGGDVPHDKDTALDRHRFLGFAVMLLSALSAIAVVYSAMVVVFVRSCR